jgi:predicted ester cyclase
MTDVTVEVASPQMQRAIVDKIWGEGLNKGNLAIADECLTPDFKNHGSHDDALSGPESFKNTIRMQRGAFSDIDYEILDFISEGDKCVLRWVMRGRHTGPFLGVPPTGKSVEHHAMILLRFEGNRVAERWGIVDNFGLMKQLQGGK